MSILYIEGGEHMKVEQISDTQIRFVFLAQDLEERNINVNDILTRSVDKTQGLFAEITECLQRDFAFFTADSSLMFEATMSQNTLSVLVTKMPGCPHNIAGLPPNSIGGYQQLASEIMTELQKKGYNVNGKRSPHQQSPKHEQPAPESSTATQPKRISIGVSVFSFANFDILAEAANRVPDSYSGSSKVYKMDGKLHLILQNKGNGSFSTRKFARVLCEFGERQPSSLLLQNRMMEHGDVLIADDAINKLKIYFMV